MSHSACINLMAQTDGHSKGASNTKVRFALS